MAIRRLRKLLHRLSLHGLVDLLATFIGIGDFAKAGQSHFDPSRTRIIAAE
jgi:hypothetical protein